MTAKLGIIEQCIKNDLNAIKELESHIDKLCEMRRQALEEEQLTPEEWDAILRRFENELQ